MEEFLERLVSREDPDCLVQRATAGNWADLVCQDVMEQRETLDSPERQASLVEKETEDSLDHLDFLALKETLDIQEKRDHLGCLVLSVLRVYLVSAVRLVFRAQRFLVSKEIQACRVCRDHLDFRGSRVTEELQVSKDKLANLVSPELGCQDCLALKEMQDSVD